jgi:hypothetical protein
MSIPVLWGISTAIIKIKKNKSRITRVFDALPEFWFEFFIFNLNRIVD